MDELYMRLALQAAWEYQGLAYPNPSVGAAIALDGKLLSIAAHENLAARMQKYWHFWELMSL